MENLNNKQTSIWWRKWKWWQIILVLGSGWLIARGLATKNIYTAGEITLAIVIWLAILGFVIFLIVRQRE